MNEDNLYHLGFNPKEIRGEFAILPGDPGRTAGNLTYGAASPMPAGCIPYFSALPGSAVPAPQLR